MGGSILGSLDRRTRKKAWRWAIDRQVGGSPSGDFFVSPASLKPRQGPLARDEARLSPRWLSIRDIAADLGVSASTAYKWSARGEPWFPRSIRLRNGDIRVRRDWYEQWLAEHESR
jgi:predicted DNA-binding transcriptional regulator AlpA